MLTLTISRDRIYLKK